MRIGHVTDFYEPRLGGIEVHVAELAKRQRLQGHDVQVITTCPGPPQDGVRRLGAELRHPHLLHPAALRQGIDSVRHGFDVVHVHAGLLSPLAYLGARAAARAGVPTVVTMHSLLNGYQGLFQRLDRMLRMSALPISWTAVSATAAHGLHAVLGAPVHVLPNGIDQEQWRRPAPAATRTDQVQLIAVMRLAARKRPLPLLRMFRLAQHQVAGRTRLRLLVVGDGPSLASMQRYRLRNGLDDVQFAGRLPRGQVKAALSQADLFVAPANLESFGIAALEARATGLPVIAKRRAGISEFVRDHREGLLCDSDQQMVRSIVALSVNHYERHHIAEHNRSTRCAAEWTAVLSQTHQLYLAAATHADTAVAGRA